MGVKPQPKSLTHKEFLQINKKGNLFLLPVLLVFTSSLCPTLRPSLTPRSDPQWAVEFGATDSPPAVETSYLDVSRLKGLSARWGQCFSIYCFPYTPLPLVIPCPEAGGHPRCHLPSTNHITHHFLPGSSCSFSASETTFGPTGISQPLSAHTQPHGTRTDSLTWYLDL